MERVQTHIKVVRVLCNEEMNDAANGVWSLLEILAHRPTHELKQHTGGIKRPTNASRNGACTHTHIHTYTHTHTHTHTHSGKGNERMGSSRGTQTSPMAEAMRRG